MRGFTLIFPCHTKVFCGVNSVICIDLLLKMRLYVPIKLYLLRYGVLQFLCCQVIIKTYAPCVALDVRIKF